MSLQKQDETNEKVVYVTPTKTPATAKYHTNSDCRYITDSHERVTVEEAEERGISPCKECSVDSVDTELCGAPTDQGGSCKFQALEGIGRCALHADFGGGDDGDESTDRPVWVRQKGQRLGENDE